MAAHNGRLDVISYFQNRFSKRSLRKQTLRWRQKEKYQKAHFYLPESVFFKSEEQPKPRIHAINNTRGGVPSVRMSVISETKCEGQLSHSSELALSPEDMLRRARSRLLEDLSEGNLNGDKGVLTLPHSLAKYKEVC